MKKVIGFVTPNPLEKKVKELQEKRTAILKRAQKATTKIEKEFRADSTKKPLSDKIKSYTGKFNAVVGPMLKEAKEIQKAISLIQ